MASKRRKKPTEAVPKVPGETELNDDTPPDTEDAGPEVKTRRGRPPKVRVDVPGEMIAALATAPFDGLKMMVELFTDYKLEWPQKQYEAVGPAMELWLSTKNIKLTPGWALIGLYADVLGTGMVTLIGDVQAKAAEEAEKAQKAAEAQQRAATEAEQARAAAASPSPNAAAPFLRRVENAKAPDDQSPGSRATPAS